MKRYRVNKSTLRGALRVPPSKSHTLRALLLGSLGHGKSMIWDCLPSPDARSMMEACRSFGAKLEVTSEGVEIVGIGGRIEGTEDVLDAGNSGIVLRFCSAVGALSKKPVVVTGDFSIRHQRPMQPLLDGLRQLGVSAVSMRGDGYAPVLLQGPIRPGVVEISGEDSQPVSALLIAAAFAEGPIAIEVRSPGERPWVDLTLAWLDRLGIAYTRQGFTSYFLSGRSHYEGFTYSVPGDLSSASFPIAAALVTKSEIVLENVDVGDTQGDREVLAIFRQMGGRIEVEEEKKRVHVKKSSLFGTKVDINDCIDAVTILAVVACFAEGETHIYNGAVARQKECDRIHAIATELQKMGADITPSDDGLYIRGTPLRGGALSSYHDHRMALSLTVAALGAEGESEISPVECVAKSFPNFLHEFQRLGAKMEFVV